jgi:hypothetical protein
MYYSALRPAEAATLRRTNLLIPTEGWGELLFEFSTPTAGAPWTDSGARREERQLKHRAKCEIRPIPCPPKLRWPPGPTTCGMPVISLIDGRCPRGGSYSIYKHASPC